MIFERRDRGKIFGDGIYVCRDSKLDRLSFATDKADVWQSELIASKVTGDSKVRLSKLERCAIGGGEVMQSYLNTVTMSGGHVLGAYVANSFIEGNAQIRGNIQAGGVKVFNSTVKDKAVIEGTAIVKGITLDRQMRIGEGFWERQPRYFHLVNDEIGADIGITESSSGTAFIGCTCKNMKDWIRKWSLWTKAVRWPEEMGLTLKELFEKWLDEPMAG